MTVTAPAADGAAPGSTPGVLYSVNQVAWSSLLGGPVAGIWLLVLDLLRLRRDGEIRRVLWTGIGLTVVVLLCALVAPTDLPNAAMPAATAAFMRWYGGKLLGPGLRAHRPKGQATASFWRALGATIVTLPITLLLLGASLFVPVEPINHVAVGDARLHYEWLATREDGQRVASLLRDEGWIDEVSGPDATLRIGPNRRLIVGFSVDASALDDDTRAQLPTLRHQLIALFRDHDVEIQICGEWGLSCRPIP